MTNLISWVEIPAADFARAVNFYTSVLQTDLQVIEGEEEKMACFPGGEGAISFAPGFQPGKDGALVSFNAGDDLEAALERVTANNGKVVHPRTKIEAEGRGYFAIILDSEGNKVGLYGDK